MKIVLRPDRQRKGRRPLLGRPASGFGHYLRDMVYGSLDGVITTMAVVLAGAAARGPYVGRHPLGSAAEMLLVGAVAGGAAYGVGALARVVTH